MDMEWLTQENKEPIKVGTPKEKEWIKWSHNGIFQSYLHLKFCSKVILCSKIILHRAAAPMLYRFSP